MDIIISNTSGKPIYEQITSQIKEMILNGTLKEGEALPSMRLLAKELCISIITTKRAYEDLEREGFIESYTGRGSFVKNASSEFIKEENQRQMEEYLVNAVKKAKLSNLSLEEMQGILKILYEEE